MKGFLYMFIITFLILSYFRCSLTYENVKTEDLLNTDINKDGFHNKSNLI